MTLFLGLLFGSIGTVYFIYGKRQHDVTYLITGFALMIFPYFVTNVFLVFLIGALIGVFPYARNRGWI